MALIENSPPWSEQLLGPTSILSSIIQRTKIIDIIYGVRAENGTVKILPEATKDFITFSVFP
jgi:hypothetical protein